MIYTNPRNYTEEQMLWILQAEYNRIYVIFLFLVKLQFS